MYVGGCFASAICGILLIDEQTHTTNKKCFIEVTSFATDPALRTYILIFVLKSTIKKTIITISNRKLRNIALNSTLILTIR